MNYRQRCNQLIYLAEVQQATYPEICRVMRGWIIETALAADLAKRRKRGVA